MPKEDEERGGKVMATPDVETVLLESVEDVQPPELQELVSVDGLITEPVLGIRMLMSSRVSRVSCSCCFVFNIT